MPERDVAEVFAAAVVNRQFRENFVDPSKRADTIKQGYLGIPFSLSEEETKTILEAQGISLSEIAGNVAQKLGYKIDTK